MFFAFLDGLDSLIESYIPGAKDYPTALVIYLFILALPIVIVILAIRLFRNRARDK
jgi:hypothetical protein